MAQEESVIDSVTSVYDGDVMFDLPVPSPGMDEIMLCRGYCSENSCGCYGVSCTCPPKCGTPEHCLERLGSYRKAMLIPKRYYLDPSDRERAEQCGADIQTICRNIHVSLCGNGIRNLPLSGGPCRYCAECSGISGSECRFPNLKIGSVSTYGIMIDDYLRSIGSVSEDVEGTVMLYAMILYDRIDG
ncbi:MAG: DUF2284 domain-containing protein [Candidatus Methanomethylophilaceae archaeon]